MLRLRPYALHWVLTIAVLSILFAWPLHQAEHSSEPISKANLNGGVTLSAQQEQVSDDHGGESQADVCYWCLFHAGQFPLVASHIEFSVHAESSPPPILLSPGIAPRHCPLAARPRGPPTV